MWQGKTETSMARKCMWLCVFVMVIFVIFSGCMSQPANSAPQRINTTPTVSPAITQLQYHRIYADAQGESHFDTVRVEQRLVNAAPPAPPLYLSDTGPATRYLFYSFEPGWYGDLHPSPSRQFLALLSGTVEVETSDGTVKQFGPGDIILLEDTSGKGHRSRNTGDGYLNFFVAQVPVA
jgi:mannose-6-phosphate isomerase-like protein (cupin superfamily)